jgi:hypothetical protein
LNDKRNEKARVVESPDLWKLGETILLSLSTMSFLVRLNELSPMIPYRP